MKRLFTLQNSSRRKSLLRKANAGFVNAESFESRLMMTANPVVDSHAGSPEELHFEPEWFSQSSPAAINQDESTGLSTEQPSLVSLDWNGTEITMFAGEWLVQFGSSAHYDIHAAEEYLNELGIDADVVGGLGNAGLMLISAPDMDSTILVSALNAVPDIDYFEPNMMVEAQSTPNDPLYPVQTGLNNPQDQDIDADLAWNSSTGSQDIVVGVIDSGVDYTHEDLSENMWVNPGEIAGDGIDNEGNGFIDDVYGFDFVNWDGDPMDDEGHGTHVAGTIAAAGNNGIGVTGVSWNAGIMAIKILDAENNGTSVASIVAAVNYATMMKVDFGVNIRVTNNSWGGASYSGALKKAISLSGQADILFVAAAGNGGADFVGDNNDSRPYYPASYDCSNIISVAAVDGFGQYPYFTNFGPNSVDIAAPGVNIYSTRPGNSYGYLSGTSMAAPHVSGVVVLAAAANPEMNAQGIKKLILSKSDRLKDRTKLTATNARVNALKVVVAAQKMPGVASQVGVWRPADGNFLFDTGKPGFNGETGVQFGLSSDYPITGDWDGDGRDEGGVFRPAGGQFYLDTGRPGYDGEASFQFGLPGDLPIAGDWDGDGKDEVGVFRPSEGVFYLDTGAWGYNGEVPVPFGLSGDRPIAGDWNGDGKDEVGIFRPQGGLFILDEGEAGANGETPFQFGLSTDMPLAGDWNRDGRDDVGVFRPTGGLMYLDKGARGFDGEVPFQFGLPGDIPVAGIWNASVKVSHSALGRRIGKSNMKSMMMPGGFSVLKTADRQGAGADCHMTSVFTSLETRSRVETHTFVPTTSQSRGAAGHSNSRFELPTMHAESAASPHEANEANLAPPSLDSLLDSLFEELSVSGYPA